MSKRLFSILFVALLATATFTACSNENEAVSNETTNENTLTEETVAEADILEALGTKDFSGQTYTVLNANDNPAVHVNTSEEEKTGDAINDAIAMRELFMEENYKLSMEFITEGSQAGIDKLRQSLTAGDTVYNLCFSTLVSNTLCSLVNEGYLANMNEMEVLSLQENWWSSLMNESVSLNDKLYFTTGDISSAVYLAPSCVYINTNLLNEYQIENNYYELVNQKKWTLDEFARLNEYEQDINNDGVIHANDDFAGIAVQRNDVTVKQFLNGAGIQLSTITSDHKNITVDLGTEKTINTVEKMVDMLTPVQYDDQNDIMSKMFVEGRAIAITHLTSTAQTRLRDMEDDFIILPMPKAEEAQENYYSFVNNWTTCYVGIPFNVDLDFTGFVTEAMARYSYQNIRPVAFDTVLHTKVMRDDESSKMLDIIFNSLYTDFNEIYDFGGSISMIRSVVFEEKELASSLAAIESKISSDIEHLIEVWG